MKQLFLILFTFSILPMFAQLTEEDVAMYTKVNGEEIIVFKDSTSIFLGEVKDAWYPASKVGLVKNEFFNEADSTIAEGAILYGADKKEIGEIKVTVTASEARPSDILRWRKYVWVKIDGQIKGRDIYYNSIPEKGIEKILTAKNRGGLFDKLQYYFNELGFEKQNHDEFISYTYIDFNKTVQAEKEYRAMVIIRGETSVYCVVTNYKDFKLLKQKDFKENGAGQFYFLLKPSARTLDQVIDIAYGYIPL